MIVNDLDGDDAIVASGATLLVRALRLECRVQALTAGVAKCFIIGLTTGAV